MIVAAVAAVAMFGGLSGVSNAAGPGPSGGKFHITCPFANQAKVDPIVDPGVAMTEHLHTFFGNKGVTADSTPESLLGGATTCKEQLDTSAYWVPALYRKDRNIEEKPRLVNAYYFGTPGQTVEAPPFGAEIVAGNSHATTRQGTDVVGWSCGNSQNTSSPVRDTPYNCKPYPNNHGVTAVIKFPYCWDGTGLRTPDFTYGVGKDKACPAGFDHRIARLIMFVRYDNQRGNPFQRGDLVELSSDRVMGETGGITEHADFLQSWNQDKLNSLVQTCMIDAQINCHEG